MTKQEKIPKVIKSLGTQLKYQTQQLCLSAAYQDYKTFKDNSINDIHVWNVYVITTNVRK